MKRILVPLLVTLILLSLPSTSLAAGGASGESPSGPVWTLRSDALFLHRADPGSTILMTDNFAEGGNVLLDANEFDFGAAGACNLSLACDHVFHSRWGFELVYFMDVDGWRDERGVELSPGGGVVQFATPVGNTWFPCNVSGAYRSEMHNTEMNVRFAVCDWLTLMVGRRYMGVDDTMTIVQDIGPGLNLATCSIAAQNSLSGFQAGADIHFSPTERLELSAVLKAAKYANAATNAATLTQNVGPAFGCNADTVCGALSKEFAVTVLYELTESFFVRAGYQRLWVEGVALAFEQVAVSDPFGGTATVDAGGTAVFDGAHVGLELRF